MTEHALRGRLLALALAVCIFVAGGVTGIAIERLWLTDRQASPSFPHAHVVHVLEADSVIEQLREKLQLTDHQAHQISIIVLDLQKESRALHESTMQRYRESHVRARGEILRVLDQHQASQYLQMQRRRHGTPVEERALEHHQPLPVVPRHR